MPYLVNGKYVNREEYTAHLKTEREKLEKQIEAAEKAPAKPETKK